MKTIAFDIETIADPAMIQFLPEVEVNKGLKDPVKIEADIATKRKKQIEDMGLNPMTNIICCIGWANEKEADAKVISPNLSDEKELLMWWWDIASKYDRFVTFNGRNFDLRAILLHGMLHGVRPSVNIDKGKYNRGNHIDMRPILAGDNKFAKGELEYFAQKFLGRSKGDGINGSMIQRYWEMALYDDIAKYCADGDCRITYDLWVMAESAGLLE
ncbi:MAG: ribonuclease H-like domain-containing protein [Smithella sp.]